MFRPIFRPFLSYKKCISRGSYIINCITSGRYLGYLQVTRNVYLEEVNCITSSRYLGHLQGTKNVYLEEVIQLIV